jgi:hypothetical protein
VLRTMLFAGGDEVRRLPKSVWFFIFFILFRNAFLAGFQDSVQALAYGECWPEVGTWNMGL